MALIIGACFILRPLEDGGSAQKLARCRPRSSNAMTKSGSQACSAYTDTPKMLWPSAGGSSPGCRSPAISTVPQSAVWIEYIRPGGIALSGAAQGAKHSAPSELR